MKKTLRLLSFALLVLMLCTSAMSCAKKPPMMLYFKGEDSISFTGRDTAEAFEIDLSGYKKDDTLYTLLKKETALKAVIRDGDAPTITSFNGVLVNEKMGQLVKIYAVNIDAKYYAENGATVSREDVTYKEVSAKLNELPISNGASYYLRLECDW